MPKKLNRQTIGIIQHRPVKVLQFGGGNFLRGFADWVIDVLNEKTDFNGAIDIITSVTPGTAEKINEQNGLYHLVQQGTEQGKQISETRLITSVNRAIDPVREFDAFLKSAINPDLRFIISNSTEAGITFSESDTGIDSLPGTFPGKLTLLLFHRYLHFHGDADKALVILPCELIEQNGLALKNMVLRYASYWTLCDDFVNWIGKNTFCNTLVDRIVPGFLKETIDDVRINTGFDDKLVVAAEPFYFWAIEAPPWVQIDFPTQQAGLDNIVFASDITPYRIRKVRILNGAHTAMTPVAYLRGIRTVKEAMDDPYLSAFVADTIKKEIIPTLDLPQNELTDFAAAVSDRFRNPFIKHLLLSISLNSISKFKVRVLPTMIDYMRLKNVWPENLTLSFAALICFYKGTWGGDTIPLNDSPDVISIMNKAWREDTIERTVNHILADTSLWDSDLTKLPGLFEAVSMNVAQLVASERTSEIKVH